MTIKECYEFAVKNEMTDMYVLILFLISEKKVLSFDDPKDKLMFYLQDKFKARMNVYINDYKKKLNIKYKPNVYEVKVEPKKFRWIYILAYNEQQATSYALSFFYKPIDICICDINLLMTKFNRKNEAFNLTAKRLRDQQNKIPAFLGGI